MPTLFSTILSNTIIGINIDDSGGLVVNFNLLSTFPATLVGSVYHNFVNQVIKHFGSQFFGASVFTDVSEKYFLIKLTLLTTVDEILQFYNSLFYLSLFFLVFRG